MTKEEFKTKWFSPYTQITDEEFIICAKEWGLIEHPETYPIQTVIDIVLEHLGVFFFKPQPNGWSMLSALLSVTNENIHFKFVPAIAIETSEDQGLSDSEKNSISEIWQDNKEGIITFKFEGNEEEFDLSDYPKFIEQIYFKLENLI